MSTGESIERIVPAEVMRFYKPSSERKRKSPGDGGTNGDGLADDLSDSGDDEERANSPTSQPVSPLLFSDGPDERRRLVFFLVDLGFVVIWLFLTGIGFQ